ncbi:putative transcription factor gsfR1 [Penicillium rolfsii]|nr:putative transcription factor gsfR1 [Penicillium rolfsii]
MREASPQRYRIEAKRRKVRKGTQSCWECKRRKVRCIFGSPESIICDNCRRRRTSCISQEYPDQQPPSAINDPIEARLGRVEALVKQLAPDAGFFRSSQSPGSPARDLPETQQVLPAPEPGEEPREKAVSTISNTAKHNPCLEPSDDLVSSFIPRPPVTELPHAPNRRAIGKHEDVIHGLVAAWPNQTELDIICSLPVGSSMYLHCGVCAHYLKSEGQNPPSPHEVLQLPPPGTHPVLVARKLLMLGNFLQGVIPSSVQGLESQGIPYRSTMSRVVDSAVRLVTTNDELNGSVEGLECIMLEAMYHNYAGNLHKSWMAIRRACAVAQMMAIHRGLDSPSLKILDPETRAAFDPDYLCFRLVQMDCYLSMMLGLPHNLLETGFANPQALEKCHPAERMQRIHCLIAGRILQRNDADVNNLTELYQHEKLLQKAADEMPPQWWLSPDLSSTNNNSVDILDDTMRLNDQFTQYHLLIRLHLPYMLRSPSDRRYDHSKITAVNASREILSRYVASRTSNPGHFYCRGADFLAFVGIVVMCLTYINSRSQGQRPVETLNSDTVFNFLAHCRPADRGIMERTLEIIESMARASDDAISSKFSRLIHHLLFIEANAANGTVYTTSSSSGDERELEVEGKLTNGGKVLHLYIPYLGKICFEPGVVPKCSATASTQLDMDMSTTSDTDTLVPGLFENTRSLAGLQGPPICSIDKRPVGPDLETLQSSFTWQQPNTSVEDIHCHHGAAQPTPSFPLLETFDAENDWGLQGVDIALFDSLTRGITTAEAAEENWADWGFSK